MEHITYICVYSIAYTLTELHHLHARIIHLWYIHRMIYMRDKIRPVVQFKLFNWLLRHIEHTH